MDSARYAAQRPLEGLAVGISVSYGENSKESGLSEEEMNASIVRLSDCLLRAGARLVFGHDWRPNGVMAAIAKLAVRYERPETINTRRLPAGCYAITNLAPWGSPLDLSSSLREDLQGRQILQVIEAGLPGEVGELSQVLDRDTLVAASLCHLRAKLSELCDARICIGGKLEGYRGCWPGVFEEAWGSACQRKPVFLSEMLNGAASRVIKASRDGDWQELLDAKHGSQVRRNVKLWLAARPGTPIAWKLPDETPGRADSCLSESVLVANSRLNRDDWVAATSTSDIEVFSVLVLKGLFRYNQDRLVSGSHAQR